VPRREDCFLYFKKQIGTITTQANSEISDPASMINLINKFLNDLEILKRTGMQIQRAILDSAEFWR